jgi:hypothetical protein
MKKYAILSLFVLFAIGTYAQSMRPQMTAKFTKDQTDQMVVRYDNKDALNQAIKAFGDVIYADDFGSGGPAGTNMPTGWTTVDVDAQGNNYVWKWTNVGATGPTTTGYEHVLASTSAANGWMILDSDNYGQGSYDAMLVSPSYNLSGHDAVAISFQELYKRWGNESANPYGGNPTYLGISTDGGLNYTEIEIHADFESKDETSNPGFMMVNISNIAGNATDLKVYFRIKGLWDYWWQVDDFQIIEAPYHDLVMKERYLLSIYDFGTMGSAWFGYYSRLPLSQVTPFFMQADVYNNGIRTQTNVDFTATAYSGTTVLGTYPAFTDSIQFDSTFSFVPDWFEPTVAGTYSVVYEVEADSTDELISDNITEAIDWKVTANDIMARDYNYTTALSPAFFTGAADGDLVGVTYFMANAATANSLSVFIDYRCTPGTQLLAQLYSYDGSAWVEQIRGEEYIVTENDLGHWIDLPLYEISAGDADLAAEAEYVAGIEFYWNNNADNKPWIGADDNGPHVYSQVSNLRLGSTWYWVTYIPMIRLNLSTATLQPNFANVLDTLCANPAAAGTYTRTISASDPSGLPLTFDYTDNDIITSLVNNGNGTATFTFDATTAMIGTSMLFEYSVSNGVETNNVFAYIPIVSDANCYTISVEENQLDRIQVYPNPSTGILNIENAENSNVEVVNILGEVVLSERVTTNLKTLNLSSLSQGTYYVRVATAKGLITKSINLIK